MADAYATPTETLLKMAGGNAGHAATALAAGAQRIDEMFAAGGYSTPLDIDSLAPGAARTRLEGQLAYANLAIAAWVLSSPVDAKQGTSSKVKKDYEEVMKWLALVSSRAISIVILGGSTASGLSVAGSEEWGFTLELFNIAHASALER